MSLSTLRPSGTEDVVRVYAEANTQVSTSDTYFNSNLPFPLPLPPQATADSLALEVHRKVYELAAGVGDPPSL